MANWLMSVAVTLCSSDICRVIRSDFLDFRAVGSKWQIVLGWIQDRVEDWP